MTSSMGQRRWKESWSDSGHRRNSLDCNMATKPGGGGGGGGGGSEVSSLTNYSLERPNTRDTTASFLLRDHSSLSSHIDSTNYQEKLQGWSAMFHDTALMAPRPGTSINSTRTMSLGLNNHLELEREMSFLQANRTTAFPDKPRELHDPLEGIMPSNRLVAQRKYYVLPSIGNHNDLILRRQHSSVDTLNQLDYSRDQFEDDAEFFAELIELKREAVQTGTPFPPRPMINPLPPIHKLRDVVRPRTNIAELEEDRLAFSGHISPSCMSDVEEFRGQTPDPDYADTSPRKLSVNSLETSSLPSVRKSECQSPDCESDYGDVTVPIIDVVDCG